MLVPRSILVSVVVVVLVAVGVVGGGGGGGSFGGGSVLIGSIGDGPLGFSRVSSRHSDSWARKFIDDLSVEGGKKVRPDVGFVTHDSLSGSEFRV
jgi:hypothetical protein